MTAFALAASRLVTCDTAGGGSGPLGTIEGGILVVEGGRIVYAGLPAGAPAGVPVEDLGEVVVTPGLIDAHTHACWVGSRHAEYEALMRGTDYRTIARAGGGIRATRGAVAACSADDLVDALAARLRRMASLGVTTVEVKSGYGLDVATERKQLVAIARAAELADVPSVVSTLLALHALPPDIGDRAAFVTKVARELVPAVANERLARFIDAYVDVNAFTSAEARAVGDAARTAGLGVRLHVGQFADVGGAELAASLAAASADHLEHVGDAGIEALATAGVVAVLLPMASFTLGQGAPPVAKLRAAGIRLAVASDANPGTAPTESLPLALALAVRLYGLSPDEALLGATRHAAAALQLSDRGVLRAGARADVTVWDLPHEHAIVQPWGVAKTRSVWIGGRQVLSRAGLL